MITLVRAVQTSTACPSQWDAWDADGNYYYLRYRGGCGQVTQYKSENWVDAPWKEDPDDGQPGWSLRANTEYIRTVTSFEYGHPLDGSISLEEFAEKAGLALADNMERTAFWRDVKNKLDIEFVGNEHAQKRIDSLLENVDLDKE